MKSSRVSIQMKVGLLYCTIYFVGFYKRKCEFSCDVFSLTSIRNERVYKLNKMLRLLTLWSKFCGVAIQLKPFVIYSFMQGLMCALVWNSLMFA